jgi:hypothetical protein
MMTKIKGIAKRLLERTLLATPFVKSHLRDHARLKRLAFRAGHEPGHYYSPIPDLEEVQMNRDAIFGDRVLRDIDLNTEGQIQRLEEFKIFYRDYPYGPGSGGDLTLRYKRGGDHYRYSDSVFLYSILRCFRPARIVEVGSGQSSSIMLDINERFLDNETRCTFIEPFPEERLLDLLSDSDQSRHSIVEKKVQSVPLEVFTQLGMNDILFIDSTHVSKIGSDLNFLMFEVLPILQPGVLIHFHDVFYPFEMPRQWVCERRWFWNENYLVRAFLMNNSDYEIVAFNSYLQKIERDWFEREMPECLVGSEDTGSIWIRKRGPIDPLRVL